MTQMRQIPVDVSPGESALSVSYVFYSSYIMESLELLAQSNMELMAQSHSLRASTSATTYYGTVRNNPFAHHVTVSGKVQPTEAEAWKIGSLDTSIGKVPQVSTVWSKAEYWGQLRARTGSFRMNYRIEPGLYAVGTPDEHSDVLVSANYKLSFDVLRRELGGLNVWILALDTDGINVWCAAGKGTFSSEELIRRIEASRLGELVSHRRLIVPQLAAPGVSAAEVKRQSGFSVLFGPVRAADITAYLQAGRKASREMRIVTFPLKERLVLTPIEVIPLLKKFPFYALLVLLLFGLQPSGILFQSAWEQGAPFLALGLLTLLAGSVITPALLPFLPFRSFSAKGWVAGMMVLLAGLQFVEIDSWLLQGMSVLVFPLAASYLGLQFTGSTTFTGVSAVKKELRAGMPIYKIGAALSAVLFVFYKLQQWHVL